MMNQNNMNNSSIGMSNASSSSLSMNKSTNELQIEIVEYLKQLPFDVKLSVDEILKELQIDLSVELDVLDMLKSNPKIDVVMYLDGKGNISYNFQFVREHVVRNINELKEQIKRSRNGILFDDIKDCYPDILNDVKSLIIGGELVIACKNKEKKSFVIYPRGKAFLTKLSGNVTGVKTSNLLKTSTSLVNEIRRGDAICIDREWYRVSCTIGQGLEREQRQRSTAPLSVSSDKELSDRNIYHEPFTETILPLDGTFIGETMVSKSAKRHGCSNDIRKSWESTILEVKKFRSDDDIEQALLRLGLITKLPSQLEIQFEKNKKDDSTVNITKKRRYFKKK